LNLAALPASQYPAAITMPLSGGDQGTVETIAQMCRLVDEGSRDPDINRAALAIVQGSRVPQFAFEAERQAIYRWVRQNIRFFRDIDGKETLRAARETLAVRGGDCDDYTILICALLKTIGQRVRIVTISSNGRAPEIFSHVFPEVRDERGRWIPVDAARKRPKYGRGPNHYYRRREWDIEDGTYHDVAGLGMMGCSSCPSGFRAPQMGAYRPRYRGLRGLGDDGVDWSAITAAIPSITTGTANIITAERANPLNLVPNTGALTSGQLTPAAAAAIYAQTGVNPLSSISPTTLLLLGGGLLLLMTMGRR
jgi:hypothetical protein